MIYIIITSYRWIKKNNGETDSLNQRNQQNYIKFLRVYFCWRQMDGLEYTFLSIYLFSEYMKGIVYNNIKTFILYNKHEIKIIMYKSLYINKREIVDIINKI